MTNEPDGPTVSREARTAAHWWGDTLRHSATLNNGDQSQDGATTAMMAMLSQEKSRSQSGLSEDRIAVFESELASMIDAEFASSHGWDAMISVDYHPDLKLFEATRRAGITIGPNMFPWKTTMWIDRGSVRVSSGYGSVAVTVPLDA